MRVASEQASGEKYRSMDLLGGFAPALRTQVDFYTVSHNIEPVKVLFCEMVQKRKTLPLRSKAGPPAAPKRRGRPRAYQPEVTLGKTPPLLPKGRRATNSPH